MSSFRSAVAIVATLTLVIGGAASAQDAKCSAAKYSDSHFHLTNYIQEGTDVKDYVRMMGTAVCRSTLFGIPLQQEWDYGNSGDFAPTYYLQSDAPLYYYSFTDAVIAMAYRSLPADQQARLDPMITGFNPADMYAADHIRRVLLTFPGVFSGIGEFSIHKEFVSSKVAGGAASLTESRARSPARLRRRSGARGDPAQRPQHALPEGGAGSLSPRAAAGGARAASEDDRSSGRTSAWAASSGR